MQEDCILYDDTKDEQEFNSNIRIDKCVTDEYKTTIADIVKKYWDYFCKEGAQRSILNYELAIDTEKAKPVYCRKPQYGPYKPRIMMQYLKSLLKNFPNLLLVTITIWLSIHYSAS